MKGHKITLLHWTVLSIINLISIFFILQIKFEVFQLFTCNYSKLFVDAINTFTYDLSLGLILSTLFYVIVVSLPACLIRRSTMKLISPTINQICERTQISIGYLLFKNDRTKRGDIIFESINLSNIENILSISDALMNFQYSIKNLKGQWTTFNSETRTENNHFIIEAEEIPKQIDKILSLPTIINVPNDLIDTLAKLRDCKFYLSINESKHWGGSILTFQNLKNDILNYVGLCVKLKKFSQVTEFKII